MSEFSYDIGGKKYVQKPLVFGQIRQLQSVMEGMIIPADIDNPVTLVAVLGDSLPPALAVVLTEEGKSPKGKDINAIAEELEFDISPETVIQVVEDFLDCNPIASLLAKLSGMIEKLAGKLPKTLSKKQSVSSQKGTSRKRKR